MCGIAGIYDLRKDNRADINIVAKMIKKIEHRGPDGTNLYTDDNLALGFARLSLIDLENGMQPILNEDGSIICICNGEIFNYKEKRRFLEQKGHRFKTKTDVEVILHMYEEFHTEFLNQLNGQFAFVIYDKKKKVLFCARDQVGIIPFFYTVHDGLFIFASEIKAILEHKAVERKIDLTALDQMFTFPGIISPRTMFQNINSLESGHYLYIKNDVINNIEYWDLDYQNCKGIGGNEAEKYYLNMFEEIMEHAVKTRLQADVPVGFYLSGGLDSSLIASYVNEYYEGDKKSFSIDFPDKRLSEAKCRKLMLDRIKTSHTESMLTPKTIAKYLPKVIYHSETPLKETYNVASYILSRSVCSEKIKAVLTGEGADELFGGYVGYKFDLLRADINNKKFITVEERKLRHRIWGDENFFYEKNFTDITNMKKQLYSRNLVSSFTEFDCLNYPVISKTKIQNTHIINKRSYIDFKLRLPEHLLADHGDRMCYANSVEARYPFLDPKVIEMARRISPEQKVHNFTEKYILKKLAKKRLPEKIIKRPKFAFVAQGSPELLQHSGIESDYIRELLSSKEIKKSGIFNAEYVTNCVKKYSEEGFKLNLPFESDLLILVITTMMFLKEFNIKGL